MPPLATIVIADRNPHVRDFLRREMTLEGYEVLLARNAKELLDIVFGREGIDMAIVDPDLPDEDAAVLLRKLEDRIPSLPVAVHAFLTDDAGFDSISNVVGVVEKRGNSILRLKNIVSDQIKSLRLRSERKAV